MSWSFSIGRLFGSELRVHATFFLLLAWIGASAWAAGGMSAAIANILFVVALFACVVAHEFGHALTARRYGIKTPDITLLPIGGLARLDKMPEKPSQEIAVALAGPAVNIVIWAVLALVLGVRGLGIDEMAEIENPAAGFASRLATINLFLAVFNLLPAFPMDGGRVFRAGLALFMDRVKATQIAASTGQVVAFLLGIAGLLSGNLVLILIAFFVFVAAGAENSDVAMRSVAKNLMAREAMITQFETLTLSDTIQSAGQALIRTTQHEFPVLAADGSLAGFLTRNALFSAMAEGHKMHPVSEAMTAEIPSVPLTAGLENVFDLMQSASAPAIAVIGSDNRMLGYITRENLGELMVLRGSKMGRS